MLRTISPRGRIGIASGIALVLIAVVIGITFGLTSASAHSSKSKDAKNDNTSGTSALDIRDAKVNKKGDEFKFELKLGGKVSDAMVGTNQWNFIIDSNPDCQEWLFCDPDDYLIGLQANPVNGEYLAIVIHLTTGPPDWTITPIPFKVKKNKVTFTVHEDLIGDPSELLWYANTRPGGFPEPTSDLLPDGSDNGTIQWSQKKK